MPSAVSSGGAHHGGRRRCRDNNGPGMGGVGQFREDNCGDNRQNQKHNRFHAEINRGVVEFLRDRSTMPELRDTMPLGAECPAQSSVISSWEPETAASSLSRIFPLGWRGRAAERRVCRVPSFPPVSSRASRGQVHGLPGGTPGFSDSMIGCTRVRSSGRSRSSGRLRMASRAA